MVRREARPEVSLLLPRVFRVGEPLGVRGRTLDLPVGASVRLGDVLRCEVSGEAMLVEGVTVRVRRSFGATPAAPVPAGSFLIVVSSAVVER